jgi:hypothetical protein
MVSAHTRYLRLALPYCMVDPRSLPFLDLSAFCVTREDPFEKIHRGLCVLEPLFDQTSIRQRDCFRGPENNCTNCLLFLRALGSGSALEVHHCSTEHFQRPRHATIFAARSSLYVLSDTISAPAPLGFAHPSDCLGSYSNSGIFWLSFNPGRRLVGPSPRPVRTPRLRGF